jgi:hypothetical protein
LGELGSNDGGQLRFIQRDRDAPVRCRDHGIQDVGSQLFRRSGAGGVVG